MRRYDGQPLWNVRGQPLVHELVWVLNFVSFFFLYPSTFNLLEVRRQTALPALPKPLPAATLSSDAGRTSIAGSCAPVHALHSAMVSARVGTTPGPDQAPCSATKCACVARPGGGGGRAEAAPVGDGRHAHHAPPAVLRPGAVVLRAHAVDRSGFRVSAEAPPPTHTLCRPHAPAKKRP